jgi:hypothetical protein
MRSNYGSGIDSSLPSEKQQIEKEPLVSNQNATLGFDPRPKNWPACKPVIHHDIANEIPKHHQTFIRQAYVGWYFHSFALFYNWICLFGGLIKGEGFLGFVYSLIALLLGFPVSLWVYWLAYSGVRKSSSFYFCLWFFFFILQIAAQIFFAIGVSNDGAAGLIMVIDAFGNSLIVLGVMYTISMIIWVGNIFYSIWIFNKARIVWNHFGGSEAAKKEFTQAAVQTAVDNKDTIIKVAKDNKETIKQVAIDNKDTVIQFAKDNRQTITKVAVENKDDLATIFAENNKKTLV